nr:TonB-dependent receptor [uncultured Draconibacterium sp.]
MKKSNVTEIFRFRERFRKLLLIMRLTVVLICCIILQATASSYSQTTRLNVNIENGTLQDLFKNIKEQSEFTFVYNVNDIEKLDNLSCSFSATTVEGILNECLEGTNMSYEVRDKVIIIVPTESTAKEKEIRDEPIPQKKQIQGTVTDETGEPVPGVSVVVKGTTVGTITDINGNYLLEVDNDAEILQFSFVGMKQQEVAIGDKTEINVGLEVETVGLEEVVAVGYGVQKKSVVTGSISSVKEEDLQNQSIARAEQALQGRTSGVQVIQNSGAPGAAMNIRIRGYGSNRSSEPIYIVNGTKVPDLSSIDPNDIENIEVLKDAASAAIYGAEGANGVVLVSTKSGKAGRGRIMYEFQHSIQTQARKVDVLNAADYKTYMTEAGTLPESALSDPYDTDWQDEMFEASPTEKHYLSFTGGSERGSFMLSASYLNQDGVVAGDKDNFKRYTFTFNSDYKVNDWVKVGHNVTFSKTSLKSVAENSEYTSVITSALMLDPLTPVSYKNESEIPSVVQDGIDNGYNFLKDPDGNIYGVSQYVTSTSNPFVTRDATSPITERNNLFGNVFVEFSPIEGLNITSRFGGNVTGIRTHNYSPVYYYDAQTNNLQSSVSEATIMTTYWQWENFAIYNKRIDKHNMTFLVGMSSDQNRLNNLSASGSPLTQDSPLYDDLEFLAADPSDDVSSSRTLTRKVSYFGRVNYEFDNKYLLQASLRRDGAGSDILPVDTRWGIFPAVSAGWVISNEEFFPEGTPITFVKVRGSWGQNGSLSNLGRYQYGAPLSTTGSYPYWVGPESSSMGTATAPANLSNLNLQWETSEQTDIGLEIRAVQDRITFSADYYIKKTKDLLTTGTPPLIAGNDATTVNAGNVENRGFEFDLSYRNSLADFNYNISANLSTLHNEVTYMNPNQPYLTGTEINLETATRFDVGNPIWYFYGYKTNGIDPETGNPLYINRNGETVKTVSSEDKTYIGSGIPTLMYGLNLDLSYKGFDFKAFLQGASGHDVMLGMVRTDRLNFNKLQVFFDDRWTPTNTDATMPGAATESNAWHSDLMVFGGNYLKIKQVQLGYTLPKSLVSKAFINSLRLYVSVENLHTFTNYPGVDPEVGASTVNSLGIDRGMYPFTRTFLFGANITF